MRRIFNLAALLCFFSLLPLTVSAEDFMAQGSALFDKGKAGLENYRLAGDMFSKALEANPNSYEAAWRASKAYRFYADESKKKNVANWKTICKDYGKLAMKYGEKAISLNPNAVEGHAWYGFSVGSYSDGVSVFTALKEGLKDKTQSNLEKAYQINKMFQDGAPIKALGRFWYVLPWPLQDKKLSSRYLREFQKVFPDDTEGQIFLAELLMNTGAKDEAAALLKKASTSSDKYFADWANRLLKDL